MEELCVSLKVGSLIFRWILKQNNHLLLKKKKQFLKYKLQI